MVILKENKKMLIGGGNRKVEALIKKECGLSPLLMYNPNQKPDGRIEFDEFASLALERFSSLNFEVYYAQFWHFLIEFVCLPFKFFKW